MFYNSAKPELTEEQYYVMGEIIEKGNLVDLDGRTYLMVQVSPMVRDFLKGISLSNRENHLPSRIHSRKMATPHIHQAITNSEQGRPLSEMADLYIRERGRDWTVSHRSNFLRGLSLLNEALGPNCPVRTIDRTTLVVVRDTIMALPKFYPKNYEGVSMINAAKNAQENDVQTIAPATVNRCMANIKAFFRWMHQCEYIDVKGRTKSSHWGGSKVYQYGQAYMI